MNTHELDKAIQTVCPIHGVNSNGVIDFKDEATEGQRASAFAIAANWDFSEETASQIMARLEKAIDRHLDAVANSYRYESIRTMVTYATSVMLCMPTAFR
jgi:hypothetical protein